MSEKRDKSLDTVVASALRWGAYAAFTVLLIGLISTPFVSHKTAELIDTIGVVTMMSTPAFRVFIAMIVFLRERDYKYTMVTAGVLLILLLGSIFGIGEH